MHVQMYLPLLYLMPLYVELNVCGVTDLNTLHLFVTLSGRNFFLMYVCFCCFLY